MKPIEIEPITIEQKQVMEDDSPNLLAWGQGGSGKTQCGADKGLLVGSLYPGNRIYFIRRKKVDLRATLWARLKERITSEMLVKKDEGRMYYKLTNGTEFWGLGLDTQKDVNKLASTECGMAIIEEATEIPEEYFDEKIKRAVRYPKVKFHQTLLLCNPGAPSHWINKYWLIEKRKGYKNIFMKTLPPPYLPKSYYEWLDGLTGVFAERYKKGKWVAFEGLVYPFDPTKHIIDNFDIPKSWDKIIAVDFGFDHCFVCQWWAVSPDDKWYLYRQIYMSRRIVKEHAKDMRKFCEIDNISKPVAICDHDAEDRATLESEGIMTIPAEKGRLTGQQSVYELFEQDRIFFFRDNLVEKDIEREIRKLPIKTEQEFGTYIWASRGKEDMIKKLDDGMDTMRYARHTHIKDILPSMLDSIKQANKILDKAPEFESAEEAL